MHSEIIIISIIIIIITIKNIGYVYWLAFLFSLK